jgi:hypothetical protein
MLYILHMAQMKGCILQQWRTVSAVQYSYSTRLMYTLRWLQALEVFNESLNVVIVGVRDHHMLD